ncbi:branched-chain amino acid transport system substrate-binding protein [Variovorax guangxiensis]|nr:ABC transporter substrate-binding protein [Variovorax guangxiensis]MDR6861508.1 branched-chain amino acid transport system substrate-binding protein [Variovorax guangxiensis]
MARDVRPRRTAAVQFRRPGRQQDEILIGTIQDLSGPLAAYSKEAVNGMDMRLEELNAAGGVNGRKTRLLVEDSGYDTKKAMLAAQKLVRSDKIFAVAGSMGTTIALTTQQVFMDAGVVNLFPLGSARGLYDPPVEVRLRDAVLPAGARHHQVIECHQGGPEVVLTGAGRRPRFRVDVWCGFRDEAGGQDRFRANHVQARRHRLFLASGSPEGGELRHRDPGHDIAGDGGHAKRSQKDRIHPAVRRASAAYSHLLPKLGGAVTEGLYASHSATQPYADEGSQAARAWYAAYVAKYKEEPGQFAVVGYAMMDWTIKAAEKAGANLATKGFVQAMESSSFPRDKLGFDTMTFSKTKHLGSEAIRLSQLKNGKWMPVTDYIAP